MLNRFSSNQQKFLSSLLYFLNKYYYLKVQNFFKISILRNSTILHERVIPNFRWNSMTHPCLVRFFHLRWNSLVFLCWASFLWTFFAFFARVVCCLSQIFPRFPEIPFLPFLPCLKRLHSLIQLILSYRVIFPIFLRDLEIFFFFVFPPCVFSRFS